VLIAATGLFLVPNDDWSTGLMVLSIWLLPMFSIGLVLRHYLKAGAIQKSS
jgi:hypothetical protein